MRIRRPRAPADALSIITGSMFAALVLGFFVSAPASIGGMATPMPWLTFLPVFFWGASRPGAAAAIASLALGLAHDLAAAGPPGPWALGFLAGYTAAAFQRDSLRGQPFAAWWAAFAVSVLIVAVAAFLAGWIAIANAPALGVLMGQAIATILVGPLVARVFGGFRRLSAAAGTPV